MLPSELIENKDNWLKKILARDAQGQKLFVPNPAAVQFCVMGAIIQATSTDPWDSLPREYVRMAAQVLRADGCPCKGDDWAGVIDFNNHPDTTHEQIMDLTHRVEAALYEDGTLV